MIFILKIIILKFLVIIITLISVIFKSLFPDYKTGVTMISDPINA